MFLVFTALDKWRKGVKMGSGYFRDYIIERYKEGRLCVHVDGMMEVVRKNCVYGGDCV